MKRIDSVAIAAERNESPLVSPSRVEDIVRQMSADDLRLLGLLAEYFSSAIKIADKWVKPICKREGITFENGKLKELSRLGLIHLLTPNCASGKAIYHLTDTNLICEVLAAGAAMCERNNRRSKTAEPVHQSPRRSRKSYEAS